MGQQLRHRFPEPRRDLDRLLGQGPLLGGRPDLGDGCHPGADRLEEGGRVPAAARESHGLGGLWAAVGLGVVPEHGDLLGQQPRSGRVADRSATLVQRDPGQPGDHLLGRRIADPAHRQRGVGDQVRATGRPGVASSSIGRGDGVRVPTGAVPRSGGGEGGLGEPAWRSPPLRRPPGPLSPAGQRRPRTPATAPTPRPPAATRSRPGAQASGSAPAASQCAATRTAGYAGPPRQQPGQPPVGGPSPLRRESAAERLADEVVDEGQARRPRRPPSAHPRARPPPWRRRRWSPTPRPRRRPPRRRVRSSRGWLPRAPRRARRSARR